MAQDFSEKGRLWTYKEFKFPPERATEEEGHLIGDSLDLPFF